MPVIMDGGGSPPETKPKKPKTDNAKKAAVKRETTPNKPVPSAVTDTSVGGNQGTITSKELRKSTKVERLGYATIGARLDARQRRERDLVEKARPEIFASARDAGYTVKEARELTQDEARQLNARAEKLHAGLLQIAPDLAADLVFSDIPTDELADASAAVHESARAYVQHQRKLAEQAWKVKQHADPSSGLGEIPVEQMSEAQIRARLQEMDSPMVQHWLDELAQYSPQNNDDNFWERIGFNDEVIIPQNIRDLYMQRLYVVATHPEIFEGHEGGAMQDAYENLLTQDSSYNIYAKLGQTEDGELVYIPDNADKSALQLVVEGLGEALAAPVTLPAKAGGAALRGIGADDLADWFGEKARAVESGVGYGVRNVEGAIIGGVGSALTWSNRLDDYTYSWQEFKDGKATPVSTAFFNITGMNREENEGLGAFLDMAPDILLAEVGLRTGARIKLGRTVPGVKYDGMQFLTKDPIIGRSMGERLISDIEAAPVGKVKSTLINTWKMDASLAEALDVAYKTTGKDGVLRTAAQYIDDVAEFELPRVRERLAQIDDEITTTTRNQAAQEIAAREPVGKASPITKRTGEYVHETDIGNLESIKATGIEARFDPAEVGRKFVSARDAVDLGPVPPGRVRLRFRSGDTPLRTTTSKTIKFREGIHPDDLIDVEFAPGEGPIGRQPLAGSAKALTDTASMDALIAERTSLWQRIADLEARRPAYEFPRPSYMRGWMRGVKGRSTRLGRMMQNIFGETGKLDLSKFTDDFTPKSRAITYSRLRHDPDSVIDAVRKEMNVAKVPREGQVAIIEELLAIRSPQQMFRWAENLENYLKAGATRGHKRFLTPEMEETFKFAPRSVEERISSPVTREYDTVSGTRVSKVENSLVDDAGEAMLTRPTQFLHEFYLPDMGLLREATSTVRWLDRWSKTQPWLTKAGWESLHTPAKMIKTAATAVRHVIRPSVLLSPRLWGKIQFDQTLRRFAEGYMNKRWRAENVDYTVGGIPIIPKTAKPLLAEYGMDETALGSLLGESTKLEKTIPTRVETRRIDPNPSNPQAVRVVESRIDQLLAIADDPLMKRYITDGPEGMITFLRNSPDTKLGRWFREDYEPYLAAHGKTVEDWLVALEQEVSGATFNNIGLRRALATGKWEAGGKYTTGAGGEAMRLTTELQQARVELSRTELGTPRTELLRRIDELDRRLSRLSTEPMESRSFSIRDRDAMKAEIFKNWEDGTFTMPNEVLVNRKMPAYEAKPPRDMHERLLARTRAIGEKLYGGLRPLGKFDYSRRSTFTAVFRQTRESLIERFKKASKGVEPTKAQLAQIEEQAAQRAAYITSDLHYDITARSSFDQAMKDLFWFSAVYREQLMTWGYKIPARSYWPIGAPLRLHEAFTIIDGLKGMGILEWDEYQYRDKDGTLQTGRNLVATVPWLTPFLAKLQNNTEAGRLNVEGLNPLTPGTAGTLPTISPIFELVLSGAADKAPDELRPFFDVMAELFTFDGDLEEAPSFMPTVLRDALGALGIEVPYNQLSPAAWGEAYRKGRVQAIRWAQSDLAEQGILPPQEAEKATAADIKAVYDELGIADLEKMLTKTERGYLTGELTELEQEGLQDKLTPEQINVLVDYMDQAATIRAEYADTAEPGGVEYSRYVDQVNARADYYRNTSVVLNLLGSALFPGRFTDANGVTTAGEEFYDAKQAALDSGEYSYEDDSIFDWQDEYVRKHPEAFPYSVGVHPGKYGTPTYDNQKTLDPDLYVARSLEQTHYWMDKAKKDPETGEIKVDDDVPEGSKAEVEQQFRERDLVGLAATRTVDIASLKKHDLDALGLPQFPGATDLLNDFQRAARILEIHKDADSTDSEVETLYRQYEQNLKNVSGKYGEDGAKMLQWFKATPAERLRRADYFVTPVSERTITQANAIATRATADGSGLFSEEDIWGRINFYRQIERERRDNPGFDRELRRAELALGEHGLEGRVATYEYLFFNIDEEWFGHFGTIAEGLR